jgi:hypothetical protein
MKINEVISFHWYFNSKGTWIWGKGQSNENDCSRYCTLNNFFVFPQSLLKYGMMRKVNET